MAGENVKMQNTVRIDGADYEVETLPNVAKIAIEHLIAIDKAVQRLEMARAGFAQAIKSVMDGPDAPEPVGGQRNSDNKKPTEKTNAKKGPDLKVVPEEKADVNDA